ncbi:hypothetical protein ACJMK2_012848 [Sinanodonta woodiana]|uniref:Kinesin-like protein n=1 Tax=Sinanodonta woodiana TaxID=1069815 RepID=A0ABD3VAQ4_SINWO
MDKKSKVKVVIRMRPPHGNQEKVCVTVENNAVEIFNHRNVNENIKYEFTAVYDQNCSQLKIYTECVRPLLDCSLQGQNISIFAYGPTGAGKTHTMLGPASDPGIIPRVINSLFQRIEEEKKQLGCEKWNYKVSFSYLEIYNEKVQDLLLPKNTDLPIREDAEKNILVPNLGEKIIENFDDFKIHFGPASNNRTIAATKMNMRSSRSHSILLLKVVKTTEEPQHRELHGKIYLIDLAGSEDNRRTGNKGIRLKESGAINRSLFALGEVVDAINAGLPRIPYRNSKLTRLLQDSIGGSCHSVMIVNIAPEERYYYDTYCTLNFATKSKKIVNNTTTKEIVRLHPIQKTSQFPSQPEEEDQTKRRRLDDIQASTTTPPFVTDPAHLLSPLMRRQIRLEESVNHRLEEFEQNILQQMRQMTGGLSADVDGTVLKDIEKQIQTVREQLKDVGQTVLNTAVVSQKENNSDKETEKPIFTKRSLLKGNKVNTEENSSCSPLFAPHPRLLKRNFRTMTSASDIKEENAEEKEKDNMTFNPSLQQKHNESFLAQLNTASVKELKMLHTVGAKRAKLIFDWRETYGSYKSFEDLLKIPGFTEKYLQSLLHLVSFKCSIST